MLTKFICLLFFMLFLISCTEREPLPPGHDKCYYDTINAYIIIDSVSQFDSERHTIYFKLFGKSNDEEIIHQGHPIRSYVFNNLNVCCVSAGDTLYVIAILITKGACSPHHIELLDEPHCFRTKLPTNLTVAGFSPSAGKRHLLTSLIMGCRRACETKSLPRTDTSSTLPSGEITTVKSMLYVFPNNIELSVLLRTYGT